MLLRKKPFTVLLTVIMPNWLAYFCLRQKQPKSKKFTAKDKNDDDAKKQTKMHFLQLKNSRTWLKDQQFIFINTIFKFYMVLLKRWKLQTSKAVFPKLFWLADHNTLKKNLADHIIHEIFSADQKMKLCIEKLTNFMIKWLKIQNE